MNNESKKEWNSDTIGRVYGIMMDTLYSMALHREIGPKEREDRIYDPFLRRFWITISNNAILMAVINWCKIFGAERNNDTYYSHFVDSEHFRSKLTDIDFDSFSESMRNTRDKFAAHEDPIEERGKIPDFDIAMKIMEAFSETIQEEYDIPELSPIQGTYTAYQLQIRDCLKDCKTDWIVSDEEDNKWD